MVAHQQAQLLSLASRTMALPLGRGALTLGDACPLSPFGLLEPGTHLTCAEQAFASMSHPSSACQAVTHDVLMHNVFNMWLHYTHRHLPSADAAHTLLAACSYLPCDPPAWHQEGETLVPSKQQC